MNEDQRWEYLSGLDEEFLLGGVVLSEWCIFIARDADVAFVHGAHLAVILLTVSAIETHLRVEYSGKHARLVDLIDASNLSADLKADLHALRKYRNKWVHVGDPCDDHALLKSPAETEEELEISASFAVRILRRVIYADPWV